MSRARYRVVIAAGRSEPFAYFSEAHRSAMELVQGARPPLIAAIEELPATGARRLVARYHTGPDGRPVVKSLCGRD